MLFLGTESECGVCVCEEGGPRKWKWSLHDLLAAGRGDRHLSPSWSLLGGGESVYPQSSWALQCPLRGVWSSLAFQHAVLLPAAEAHTLEPLALGTNPTLRPFHPDIRTLLVHWSSWHLCILSGHLGVPGAPGHQVWEHPWAYVSGHCPFLLSAPMCGRWGLPDLQPHLAMPLGVGSEPDVPRLPYTTPPFLSSDLRASSYFRFCLTGTPPGHILLFPWSSFHPSSLSGAIITERM